MSARVNLPPGCYGLTMADGTKYRGKPGGSVTVEDHHASHVSKSRNGQLGIVSGSQSLSIGTRTGKRCVSCAFLAQAWAESCPRCGGEVREE